MSFLIFAVSFSLLRTSKVLAQNSNVQDRFKTFSGERHEIPEFRTYGEPESAKDAMAIKELIRDYKDAWGKQDVDALIKLYAYNSEWINAYGRIIQGAAPLADFLENRLFPNWPSKVSKQEAANMQIISIRYLPRTAIVQVYAKGKRGASRNKDGLMRHTYITLVLAKQSDGWKVVDTVIMDAR
jgi:ketosteroid isomerase-like protein